MFYGRDLAESLVEIDSRSPEVTLQGHAALPATNRANRTWQLLFLNGRFIQDKSVNHAMNEAYRGLIQEHRFPIVFLFLEMSPSEVDVNVHPTKLEVRFRSGYNLYGRVIGCIRSALLADERVARLEVDAQPTLFNTSPSCRPDGDQRPEEPVGGSPVVPAASAGRPAGPERRPDAAHPSAPGSRERERPGPSGAAVNARRSPRMPGSGGAPQVPSSAFRRHFPLPPAEGAASASAPGSAQAGATEPLTGPSHEVPARVPPPQAAAVTPRESFGSADHTPRQRELDGTLGPGHPPQFVQIHNAYIVQETSEGFIVVDQHALHERILYWELTQKAQQQQMETQRLLLPEPVDVTPKELAMARELRPVLKELGLEVEEFGRSSLVIQSVPSFLRDANPSQLLHDILSELGEGERPRSLERIREHILSTMACRGAVRFGDRLTADQIASLLERAARIPESVSCAHGRPTRLSVSLKDLGRQFGRT
jgi:DNA mismatch repair protein MutL